MHAVDQSVAKLFERFDLGDGGIYPTELYLYDRQTRIDADYVYLDFGNAKTSTRPDDSKLKPNPYRSGHWGLPSPLRDGDVAVDRTALEGPDLWIDPQVQLAFFFSDPLAQALESAGVAKAFRLKSCRVI